MPRRFRPSIVLALAVLTTILATPRTAAAQENYEIQVYGSETIPRGVTMFELHSNYTIKGRRGLSEFGELPTYHAWHETVEITHGFNDWSELGFYWFTAKPDNRSFEWVGTHIRPRVRAPESWGWPVGVSISQEIGYARARYSADTWTYELRPIIDKQIDRWYVSLNPVLSKSLRGPNANKAFDFGPNVDVGYDVTKRVNLAIEYYGATGTIRRNDPIAEEQHQLFGVVNLDLGPAWEFNFGYGTALTAGGDKSIVKLILGRRVGPKIK
ncbi:MAG: hypothetical protein JWM41_4248 [Gemmatimonadetes bacterium]|nr:hypothetical protein [Gemmatimonadota bacterium]